MTGCGGGDGDNDNDDDSDYDGMVTMKTTIIVVVALRTLAMIK